VYGKGIGSLRNPSVYTRYRLEGKREEAYQRTARLPANKTFTNKRSDRDSRAVLYGISIFNYR